MKEMLSRARMFAKKLWARIPILGGLADCSGAHHRDALGEFLITGSFQTATFWLTALFLSALTLNRGVPYLTLVESTFENGELLIFAVSLLGPIYFTSTDDPVGAREFPGKKWHGWSIILLGIVCTGLFAGIRTGGGMDLETVIGWSIYLTIACLALRYLTIVYHRARLNASAVMKEKEREFADGYQGPKK